MCDVGMSVLLCLRQAILAGWLKHYVLGSLFRPLVRLLPLTCVNSTVNTIFWRWVNRFWYKLAQVAHGARTWNDEGSKLKVTQGQNRIPFGEISEEVSDEF